MRDAAIADADLMLGGDGVCGEISTTRKPTSQIIAPCSDRHEVINYDGMIVDLSITSKANVNIGELIVTAIIIEITSPEIQINKLNIINVGNAVMLAGANGFTAEFHGKFYHENSEIDLYQEILNLKSELSKLKPS